MRPDGGLERATSTVVVACDTALQSVTSDLMGTFAPGGAEVLVRATAGSMRASVLDDVELASQAEELTALLARFSEPFKTRPELAPLLEQLQASAA